MQASSSCQVAAHKLSHCLVTTVEGNDAHELVNIMGSAIVMRSHICTQVNRNP